ncbi:hypothetical protein B9Z19DRAFT_1060920 [Tuber borchii]|uniref:Uncharacterized protein n=1 Tax=Tuber borchii TaxID=42251 RepID=A0A2T7A713_TUBBO|nr:hypothetical protein B9Z19DRAFT_1060920 [Tuber borchii]
MASSCEYINKDQCRSEITVSSKLRDLSIELLDHELSEIPTSASDSPYPIQQSSSPYRLHSSPPLPTIRTKIEQERESRSKIHNPDTEKTPSLIATTAHTPGLDSSTTLSAITLRAPENDLPSSPLSTIPDSPEPGSPKLPSAPLCIPPPVRLNSESQIPLPSTSKCNTYVEVNITVTGSAIDSKLLVLNPLWPHHN